MTCSISRAGSSWCPAPGPFTSTPNCRSSALKKKGKYGNEVVDGSLVLRYERETYARETWISSTESASVDEKGFTFNVTVPAHGEWSTELDVVVSQGSPDGTQS